MKKTTIFHLVKTVFYQRIGDFVRGYSDKDVETLSQKLLNAQQLPSSQVIPLTQPELRALLHQRIQWER